MSLDTGDEILSSCQQHASILANVSIKGHNVFTMWSSLKSTNVIIQILNCKYETWLTLSGWP